MNCEWRNVSKCDCLLRKCIYTASDGDGQTSYTISLPFRHICDVIYYYVGWERKAKQTVLSHEQIVLLFFLTRISQFWSVVVLWRCGIWQCMRTASNGVFVWRRCCVMKRNVKSKCLRCVAATNNHSLRERKKKQQTEAMCVSLFNIFFLFQSLFSFATVVAVVVGSAHSMVTDITKGPTSDTSSSVHNDTLTHSSAMNSHVIYS